MPSESLQNRLARWRVDELLGKYPGLRLLNTRNGGIEMAGTLSFTATMPGLATIQDDYEVQLKVPEAFPKAIPTVLERGGRIPVGFHKLTDGGLCLGSPTRLLLALRQHPSLPGFVETCLIPYLYARSYFERHATMPFGELDHGLNGIRQDLALLFNTTRTDRVAQFARLTAMKKRHANKQPCPCGSGKRLGRCHHIRVNKLREQLGRGWFGHLRNTLS
jgi:hypothetical protein